MAKHQTAADNAAEEKGAANGKQAVSDGAAGQERLFPLEVLRANCARLFGCASSTFDGAFFGAVRKKAYTVKEAKDLIEKWKGRGIGG